MSATIRGVAHQSPNLVGPEDWRLRGACRWEDPELFFPHDWDTLANRKQIAEAKAVCLERCPVLTQCRDWAMARNEYGILAGMTAKERTQIRKGGTVQPPSSIVREHGTTTGHSQHRRFNEPQCSACKEAMKVTKRNYALKAAARMNEGTA